MSVERKEQLRRVRNSLLVVDGVLALSILGTVAGVGIVNGFEQISNALVFVATKVPDESKFIPVETIVKVYRETILPSSIIYGSGLSLTNYIRRRIIG